MPTAGASSHFEDSRLDHLPSVKEAREEPHTKFNDGIDLSQSTQTLDSPRRKFSVRCDQAASLSVESAKSVPALECTHCFSASLITPALWRQSAFMSIRAADAASLIGKINSMSHARCMAD